MYAYQNRRNWKRIDVSIFAIPKDTIGVHTLFVF